METDNAKTQAHYLCTLSLFLGCFTVSWFTRYSTDALTLLFAKRYVPLSRTLIKSPPTVITLNVIWQQNKNALPSYKAAQNLSYIYKECHDVPIIVCKKKNLTKRFLNFLITVSCQAWSTRPFYILRHCVKFPLCSMRLILSSYWKEWVEHLPGFIEGAGGGGRGFPWAMASCACFAPRIDRINSSCCCLQLLFFGVDSAFNQ